MSVTVSSISASSHVLLRIHSWLLSGSIPISRPIRVSRSSIKFITRYRAGAALRRHLSCLEAVVLTLYLPTAYTHVGVTSALKVVFLIGNEKSYLVNW